MIKKEVDLNRVLTNLSENNQPDIEFSYYAHYMNYKKTDSEIQADNEEIIKLSTNKVRINVSEILSDRPLSEWPEIVDIFIKFAAIPFVIGFFGEMGSDLYTKLKEKTISLFQVKRNKTDKLDERGVHVTFPYFNNGKNIIIIVALKASQLKLLGKGYFTIKSIISFTKDETENFDISKILIMPINKKPHWKVVYYYDTKGTYFCLKPIN
jgi:hypothetical protein